jgi:hypothetical protein
MHSSFCSRYRKTVVFTLLFLTYIPSAFAVATLLFTQFKILLYLLWAAGDDNETQSKGVVVILWPVAEIAVKHLKRQELIRETQKKWLRGFPTRACAFHFCVSDTTFFQTLTLVFAAMLTKSLLPRIKFHVGMLRYFYR